MQRQHRQVTLVAALSMLPFLSLLSGGLLALVTLHRGMQQGLTTGALALGLLCGVYLVNGWNTGAMVVMTGVTWGPILLLAGLLGAYRSMTLAFQVSAVLAVLSVSLVLLWMPDPVTALEGLMSMLKEQFSMSGQQLDQQTWESMFRVMPGVMTGLMALGCLACLFFGRSWQDSVEGSAGRFGSEFRQLKLGTIMTALATLAMGAALLTGGLWAENVTWVFVILLLVQGLSLVHCLVTEGRWPVGTLFAVYGLLVLVLQLMLPLLAVAGFLDNWFDLRQKLARRT